MAGAYCKFCDQRCFVYREVWRDGKLVWAGHMATCPKGMALDRSKLGVDYTTAHNPHAGPPVTQLPYLVVRGTDESTDPLVGLLLGREDEDRVVVLWGDERYAEEPVPSIEQMSELRGYDPGRPR